MPYSITTWVFLIFGICASQISAVLFSDTGTIAQPVLVAILNAPSRNGSRLSSSPLFRVPSGNTQMEMPLFT